MEEKDRIDEPGKLSDLSLLDRDYSQGPRPTSEDPLVSAERLGRIVIKSFSASRSVPPQYCRYLGGLSSFLHLELWPDHLLSVADGNVSRRSD